MILAQFEYKSVWCKDLAIPHDTALDVSKLNLLGLDGWELVMISSGECIFKRKIERD